MVSEPPTMVMYSSVVEREQAVDRRGTVTMMKEH